MKPALHGEAFRFLRQHSNASSPVGFGFSADLPVVSFVVAGFLEARLLTTLLHSGINRLVVYFDFLGRVFLIRKRWRR